MFWQPGESKYQREEESNYDPFNNTLFKTNRTAASYTSINNHNNNNNKYNENNNENENENENENQ